MRAWNAEGAPRKPRVLCIGAQKAGTSWLHQQLNEHPKIWTTPFKELHYFNARHNPHNRQWLPWHFRQAVAETEKRFRKRGEEMPEEMVAYLLEMTSGEMFTPKWYRRAFAPAPRGMLPLDTTPEYSTLPDAGVDEIAEFLPNAKFIYLIRDPVDRAISQLKMNLARNRKLPKRPRGYLNHLNDPDLDDRGDYATYVPRWQTRFGPDRLLILPYGRIATDPEALMREVEEFLGLPAHRYQKLTAQVHKGSDAPPFPEDGVSQLRVRFDAQYRFLEQHFGAAFCALLKAPGAPSLPTPQIARHPGGWDADGKPKNPSVIGIGAQKAGTSWLHTALAQHPALWTAPLKEAHYYDHLHCPSHRSWTPGHVSGGVAGIRRRHARQGLMLPPEMERYLDQTEHAELFTRGWYRSLFAPAPKGTRPVDITPAYSGLPPEGVDQIASDLPEAQFIYLIRDPADRAISQIRMNLSRQKKTPQSLDDWLRASRNPAIAERGDYASFVPRWRDRLGARLLIEPYGRIAAEPEALMRDIEGFLGLDPASYTGLAKRVFTTPGMAAPPPELRPLLVDLFADQYAFLDDHFDAAFNAALR